jgi:RNA polymerase sigma-70 factor (ECF subfamily)
VHETPRRENDAGGGPRGGTPLSRAEFAILFQDHARVLWTVAAAVLGEASEADDVLQEAALLALPKVGSFDPRTSFVAWMSSFVRNVALNHARKRGRRGMRVVDAEELGGSGAAAHLNGEAQRRERLPIDRRGELTLDQAAFDDRVQAALRALAPTARAALLLRTVLELSYGEISAVLAIPEGTAMSHVHRSRVALRHALDVSTSAPEPNEPAPARVQPRP